jgi:hypothetical protein
MSDYLDSTMYVKEEEIVRLRSDLAATNAIVDEITAALGERYGTMTTVEGVKAVMADLAAKDARVAELEAQLAGCDCPRGLTREQREEGYKA